MKRENYVTNIRTQIDNVFLNNKELAYTATDIENALKELGVSVNKTTIYRYLTEQTTKGNLIKFNKDNGGTIQYKYNEKLKNCSSHLHLQCVNCGKIEHLDCKDLTHFSNHILSSHNFSIDFQKSILYGICLDCKNILDK